MINYIVVGYGRHAREKLIPAIYSVDKSTLGLVTRNADLINHPYYTFKTIESAIDSINHIAIFLIATPPDSHFNLVKIALEAGHDVFVEKPAFINHDEVDKVSNYCKHDNYVVELLMHRYTNLYSEFFKTWERIKNEILVINIIFKIPTFPVGSFRSNSCASTSVLYDIGCYAISLLDDIGLSIINVADMDITVTNNLNTVNIKTKINTYNINIEFGLGNYYENFVELISCSQCYKFSPFFYGREGEREVEIKNSTNKVKFSIIESNAFVNMLLINKSVWLDSQSKRFLSMSRTANTLDMIGKKIFF